LNWCALPHAASPPPPNSALTDANARCAQMAPGSALGTAAGFKETEQSQLVARAAGKPRSATHFSHSSPVWLEPPPHLKAPARVSSTGAETAEEPEEGDESSSHRDSSSRLFRDFKTLASASRRANNPAAEGNAYFCISILHENNGAHAKASSFLQRFLQASIATGNVENQVLALNALGVNLHLQSDYEAAVQFHQQHLDLAHEHMSQFVAYTNLGVAAVALGDFDAARSHHENALRCTVQGGSLQGEACATANLGCVAMRLADYVGSQALLERYLRLSQSLKDAKGKSDALMFLGKLATSRADLDAASDYYSQAMQTSAGGESSANRESATNSAKCSYGIVSGTKALNTHMEALRAQLD
jgi:tetratricopeptide (TPR) repeat protein